MFSRLQLVPFPPELAHIRQSNLSQPPLSSNQGFFFTRRSASVVPALSMYLVLGIFIQLVNWSSTFWRAFCKELSWVCGTKTTPSVSLTSPAFSPGRAECVFFTPGCLRIGSFCSVSLFFSFFSPSLAIFFLNQEDFSVNLLLCLSLAPSMASLYRFCFGFEDSLWSMSSLVWPLSSSGYSQRALCRAQSSGDFV